MKLSLHQRFQLSFGLICTFLLAMLLGRVAIFHSYTYLFLLWNVFLAWLPYLFSRQLKLEQPLPLFAAWWFAWLVFLPNAPYIVTDFFHLRHVHSAPIWYDVMIILTAAWLGLLSTFFSLWNVEKVMRERYGSFMTHLSLLTAMLASGFAIYIGRYLRWNSWDIIASPLTLGIDLVGELIHPFSNPRPYGVTILFGAFLGIAYYGLRLLLGEPAADKGIKRLERSEPGS